MCIVHVVVHTCISTCKVSQGVLTNKRQESREVEGHHKQVDVSQATAGLEVAEWVNDAWLFSTVFYVDLGRGREREGGGREREGGGREREGGGREREGGGREREGGGRERKGGGRERGEGGREREGGGRERERGGREREGRGREGEREGGRAGNILKSYRPSPSFLVLTVGVKGHGMITTPRSVHTCQQMCGFFFASMYCVRGEGSSSYLSNGKFSTSSGGVSTVLNHTTG